MAGTEKSKSFKKFSQTRRKILVFRGNTRVKKE
jgi:hypothetical protein